MFIGLIPPGKRIKEQKAVKSILALYNLQFILKIQGYPQMTRLQRRLYFSPFSRTRGSWKANWLVSVLII